MNIIHLRDDKYVTGTFMQMYFSGGFIPKQQLTDIVFEGNKGLATYWINELILRGTITQVEDTIAFDGDRWKKYINLNDLK